MRYDPLPASFFEGNRSRLALQLPPGSLVVLHSNDVMPTNADGSMAFHQNANLFYLCGIDQEETVLLMLIDGGGNCETTLLLRETSDTIAIWEGKRLSKEEASELSGIGDVRWTAEYESILGQYLAKAAAIYLEADEHPRAVSPVETRNMRMGAAIKKTHPGRQFENIYPVIAEMRMIKQPVEIEALRKACSITAEGFTDTLPRIKPGIGEWEIEASLSYEYIRRGARKFSFLPIIASGPNSCVLHYISNDNTCKDGGLVLLDIGAEYGCYNGDMTRTVPVNGKFTPRQREVYEAVLRTMEYAEGILRPGIQKSEYERKIRVHIAGELLGLGLLTPADIEENPEDPPAVRRYFMHGCSHHLGLDVHDVGAKDPVISAGMVFTIEPGIYIREESIGIRLENDYLVGEKETLNLMPNAPIRPDDIERLMAK